MVQNEELLGYQVSGAIGVSRVVVGDEGERNGPRGWRLALAGVYVRQARRGHVSKGRGNGGVGR
jgi:hypothetical protein